MYRKILVPMALSHDLSPKTLTVAKAICVEGGEIVALHVHEAPSESVRAFLDEESVNAGFDAAKARLEAKLRDHPGVTAKILRGHSGRTIIDCAADQGFDCIVMGSHKPGMSDYFLGSTAARVVRHAHCSVHVVRDDA